MMIFIKFVWLVHIYHWNWSETRQIFWSGVQCCGTSLCCEWADWAYGTRSHQSCPRFPHRPAWGDLRWPPPPAPPVSGTGSSCPPPLPASASWRGTAGSHVPMVGKREKNMTKTDTVYTKVFRVDKTDSKWLGIESVSTRGSHLWAEVRWQCFSSSETLHKESFPVWVFMLYACREDHKRPSAAITSSYPTICALILQQWLTFGRYEGFAAGSAPSHWVHLWDTEVTPEVFAVVAIKAFIPQQSLEA